MRIESPVDPASEEYLANRAAQKERLAFLESLWLDIAQGGGQKARDKHLARGRLPVRDRIALLLDPGTPFLEFSILAAWQVYEDPVPAAALIAGVGQIAGQPCVVVAHDPTVKGGTYYPLTVKKHLRAQQIAFEHRLPCVYLVDSGGANLPHQAEVFPDAQHFGRIFFNEARMSAAGLPQIAVVLGSCTAGGAYIPAMADESIMVDGAATIFLAGPPLVKAATGEVVSAEELGGARIHCEISGVSDHFARDEKEALFRARKIVSHLGKGHLENPAARQSPLQPAYDPEEILGLIPHDVKKPIDLYAILARILDGSELDEFKSHYGTTLICGFARIEGFPVGIIANQGVLFSESALKGTHFIQLCEQRQIPLVFFQNITGFMVGKKYEHEGIAKHGAKMVNAVSCATVPKYTVIVGGSFGAGNYGMCGRAYDPRFLWTWPNARTAVMGGRQAAEVMAHVQEMKYQSQGELFDPIAKQQSIEALTQRYDKEASAEYGSARLWDDGVIDPRKTRQMLALALALNDHALVQPSGSRFGIFRM